LELLLLIHLTLFSGVFFWNNSGLGTLGTVEHDLLLELDPHPSPPLLWCLLLEQNNGLGTLGTGKHDLLLELELFLLVHFLLFSGVFFWNKIADKEHWGKMIFS
jgi:hypothetical protein